MHKSAMQHSKLLMVFGTRVVLHAMVMVTVVLNGDYDDDADGDEGGDDDGGGGDDDDDDDVVV